MARIIRWNPIREMAAMQNMMDRVFDEALRTTSNEWAAAGNWLALDLVDRGDGYVLEADVPGLTPDDIEITLHDNVLTISGELKQQTLPEGTRRILSERTFGRFRRSITLPETIDADRVEAAYAGGVLRLTLPRSEAAKPRQISVKPGKHLQDVN